jgi:hypothetical protein
MVHDVAQSGVGTGSKTFTRALVKDDVGQTFTVPAEDPAVTHGEQRLFAIQHHKVSFPGFDQRGSGGHELVRGIVVIIGSEDRRAARRILGDRRGPFRRRRRGEPPIRPDQMILLGTEERRRHHFFRGAKQTGFSLKSSEQLNASDGKKMAPATLTRGGSIGGGGGFARHVFYVLKKPHRLRYHSSARRAAVKELTTHNTTRQQIQA